MASMDNICCRCGEAKPRHKPNRTWCKECTHEYARRRNPMRHVQWKGATKAYRQRLRKAALLAYGGKCTCCGEDRPEFLAIDHIDGGGNEQRRTLRASGHGMTIEVWLRQQNYPSGYRVLCHNCNQALGHYGYCPHVVGSSYLKEV